METNTSKLYKTKDNKNFLLDMFFFIKIIGVILFSVMDIIVSSTISLYCKIKGLLKFDIISEKYNLYRNRENKISTIIIPNKIKGEIFSIDEEALVFGDNLSGLDINESYNEFISSKHYFPQLEELSMDEELSATGTKRKFKAMVVSFLWLKKKAEKPEEQKKYNKSVRFLVSKSNLTWNLVKKGYDKFIAGLIIKRANPAIKNHLMPIIKYYQEPTIKNFKRLVDFTKELTGQHYKLFIELIKMLDPNLLLRIKSANI